MDEVTHSREAGPPAVPQTEARASAHDHSSPDELSDFEADLSEDLDLLSALDKIESAGSFVSFAALPALNLDLVVKDVGAITLPLQESQARQIIEKARQAPCGKGEKTIVDTSIRNTWELDTSQFELQGAEWGKLLARIVARVKKDLGVGSPIRAEPYKMLMYETGAMFKPHTDSPKIPGMFGTLVICLPSPHEGGDVIVKHRREKKILRSSKVAQGFMSWYSDVQHEVLPVTSGYRWVLTYNLALDPSAERPSARLVRAEISHLRRVLRQWLSEAAGSQHAQPLIYPLDHHYTEASISLEAFKGRDVAVVQALRDISSELPMDIFLGILEKTAMGPCGGGDYGGFYGYRSYDNSPDDEDDDKSWHSLDDIIETTFAIKKLVDLDGVHLAEDVDITEDNLLRDCFKGVDGEEISYEEGYAGNEGGPSATHAYRASGVLLLPRASTLSFLQRIVDNNTPGSSRGTKEDNLQSLLAYISNKCKEPSKDGSSLLMLKSLCRCSWDPNYRALYSWQVKPAPGKAAATGLLQASARMKDWEFFDRVVENTRGNFGLEFFAWIKEEITNGLPFSEVQNALLHAVLSLRTLSDMLAAVTTIAPQIPDRQLQVGTNEVQEWEQTTLERALDAAESKALGYIDGQSVVHHCLLYRDVMYIQTRVAPFVEKQTKQVAFSLGFLASVALEARKSESPQRQQWLGIFEPLAKSLISAMSIPAMISLKTPDSVTKIPQDPGTSSAPAQYHALAGILSEFLSKFYEDLFALETATSLTLGLTAKIAAEAHLIKPEQFPHIWIPLLRELIPVLDRYSIPLSTPQYQHLYTTLLTAYLEKCVGKQPTKPTSLRRPTVSCTCIDCVQLNVFLADPNQRTFRIAVNKKRREHLQSNLGYGYGKIDCTHATERVGSPQTLVVTKTTQAADLERTQWRARKSQAEKVLGAFPRGKLKVLLAGEYERIVRMDGIGEARWVARSRELAGAWNGGQVSGDGLLALRVSAGVKRKAEEPLEVIDLTGED